MRHTFDACFHPLLIFFSSLIGQKSNPSLSCWTIKLWLGNLQSKEPKEQNATL
jgi:hypothetical protein